MLTIDGNDLGKRRADNDLLVGDGEACLEAGLTVQLAERAWTG
jgi:hypothetical protein